MTHKPLLDPVRLTALALVFAFVPGCSAGGAASQPEAGKSGASPAEVALVRHNGLVRGDGESQSIADVVETVLPSVVSVTSTKKAQARSPADLFFGRRGSGRPAQGLGSGVILSEEGLIVTNNHVIDGADEVQVQTHDGREYDALVVGADPKSDVAVLKLKGEVKGLIPIRVGDSSALRLGEVVLAVGNPFGVGQTVTMGIVSATGRSDMGIVDYENFIQTDAAINPGNSGGALVNMHGELVGINTAILSRSGGSMGIGFAIPTNMAAPIIESLKTDGQVSRGWLGVRIQELDSDLKDALGLQGKDGVLIADVEKGSPAEKGGLRSGDVVTHVGKNAVSSAGQFRNLIASSGAAAKVELTLIRDEKKRELTISLGQIPGETETPKLTPKDSDEGSEVEGLALRSLDDNLRRRLQVPADVDGAVIVRVSPGSREERAELRPGDVILEINRNPVKGAEEAKKRYSAASGTKLLRILRGGSRLFVVVK